MFAIVKRANVYNILYYVSFVVLWYCYHTTFQWETLIPIPCVALRKYICSCLETIVY